jgi:hypothetical protein
MLTTKFERAEYDDHGRITFLRYQLLYDNVPSNDLFREYEYRFNDEDNTVSVSMLEYLPYTYGTYLTEQFCFTYTNRILPNRNWKLPGT